MIQITINHDDPISQFIEARAAQLGQNPSEAAEVIVHESFLTWVQTLHEQFMHGEISQGKMAEIMGISRVDLIHLLEKLNLQVTNL